MAEIEYKDFCGMRIAIVPPEKFIGFLTKGLQEIYDKAKKDDNSKID